MAGCGSGTPRYPPGFPSPSQVPRSAASRVIVVVMENKEFGDVIGKHTAPFINALANRGALATQAFAVTHPSLPNYLALVGGSTGEVTSDCTSCHLNAPNLVDQFEAAGVTWKAYMEAMPQRCFRGAQSGRYAKKHDPFIYYDDVAGDPARCGKIVPARELSADLRGGRLPSFAWITPDLCNDMHDCSVQTGDRYLARLIPSLTRAIGPHGFLILLWDEGGSDRGCCRMAAGGRVPLIVVGPDVRAGTRSAAPFDHYSVLRTIEQTFGLPALAGAACDCSPPLVALFTRPPRITPTSRVTKPARSRPH